MHLVRHIKICITYHHHPRFVNDMMNQKLEMGGGVIKEEDIEGA
jgi:hypothetical protein